MNLTRYSRAVLRLIKAPLICETSRRTPTIVKYHLNNKIITHRNFCSTVFSKSPDYQQNEELMDLTKFEPLCAETLESLTDYFEEIVEADEKLGSSDVSYSVS